MLATCLKNFKPFGLVQQTGKKKVNRKKYKMIQNIKLLIIYLKELTPKVP